MSKGKIGITTTIPVEIVYAANYTPVDLNNIFITNSQNYQLVEKAEAAGFPRNLCAWIKGIYSTIMANSCFATIIGVTQGDCSNTQALMEVLKAQGIPVTSFAYPSDADKKALLSEMDKLIKALDTSWSEVRKTKEKLDKVRAYAHQVDLLTWKDNKISGQDNHLALVNCSDFKGDWQKYEEELKLLISKAKESRSSEEVRLGFIGVPSIFTDLYQFVESLGAHIVYNEVQHQFSMPVKTDDVLEQYRSYTYPYGIFARLKAIKKEIEKRKLAGIIHYVQSFCFHHVEDLVVRQELKGLPLITLEGDKPGPLDSRTRLRIEAFIETIREGKELCSN